MKQFLFLQPNALPGQYVCVYVLPYVLSEPKIFSEVRWQRAKPKLLSVAMRGDGRRGANKQADPQCRDVQGPDHVRHRCQGGRGRYPGSADVRGRGGGQPPAVRGCVTCSGRQPGPLRRLLIFDVGYGYILHRDWQAHLRTPCADGLEGVVEHPVEGDQSTWRGFKPWGGGSIHVEASVHVEGVEATWRGLNSLQGMSPRGRGFISIARCSVECCKADVA